MNNLISINEYIGNIFVGNTYRFKCDCIVPLDINGTVVDFEVARNEIILLVNSKSKILHIGLNTPNLYIEEL